MIRFEVNQQSGKKISLKLIKQWLKKAQSVLKLKKDLEISIGIVGDEEMKKLNKIYRGKNKITDVLSFGEVDSKFSSGQDYLGEIIICYPQSVRQAKKAKQTISQEIELLLVHGLLHLLGHDHEKIKENKVMRDLEQKIIVLKSK